VVGASLMLAAGGCAGGADAEDEATIAIRYSKFLPDVLTARAGEPVTITLRNDDPIGHEWIVGKVDVHARHRTGTEPSHDAIPTEVTIPALDERTTTVTFDEPGEYAYICHLPGHEAYGMVGTLRVVAD
jgi:plastocyanin